MIQTLSTRLRGLQKLPAIARYGLAAGVIALVTTITLTSPAVLGRAPFLLFFPAILLIAIVLDHGSSLFATALATAAALYFLIEPRYSFAIANGADILVLALFALVGLGVATIVEALRHAVDGLSRANAALVVAGEETRRQAALLDGVLEGIAEPIFVKDREGRFVLVNRATATLFGDTVENVIGRRDRDYLPAEQVAAIEATDAEVVRNRRTLVREEIVRGSDGVSRVHLSTKAPWLDSDGAVRGLIGVSRDIAARKAAEQALEQADAQKRLLLYDINHRVKNHLQTVVGPMALAARRADTLDAACGALNAAVGRLTVLGRVYTRLHLADATSVVDARSFIEELSADLAASLAGQHEVTLRCAAESARLDANRAVTLGLVINELVQNALKYAFPGERAGVVALGFTREGDDYVLRVADDGIGMSEDAPAQGGGTGQRLVRAMARQLDGTLTRDDVPGTAWTLRFPVAGPAA